MKNKSRFIAALLAIIMGASFVGCGNDKKNDKKDKDDDTSISENDDKDKEDKDDKDDKDDKKDKDKDDEKDKDKDDKKDKDDESSADTTKRPSRTEREEASKAAAEEASKEAAEEASVQASEAASESASEEASKEAEKPTKDGSGSNKKPSNAKGFSSASKACEAVLQAYLDKDAEAVYACFYPEEADLFKNWMESFLKEVDFTEIYDNDEIDTIKAMYSKEGIIEMIQEDIDQISDVMKSEQKSDKDKWTFDIGEEEESDTSTDELEEELGFSVDDIVMYEDFTLVNKDADVILDNYDFYNDTLYFVKVDGAWYLCYTSSCSNYLMGF